VQQQSDKSSQPPVAGDGISMTRCLPPQTGDRGINIIYQLP